MKKTFCQTLFSTLLLAMVSPLSAAAGAIPSGYSDAGFAERCDDESAELTTLEDIACSSESLRAQENKMLDLVEQVKSETRGADGETGEAIDPMGTQQKVWRDSLTSVCFDAQCLKAAYAARITDIQKEWAQALQ